WGAAGGPDGANNFGVSEWHGKIYGAIAHGPARFVLYFVFLSRAGELSDNLNHEIDTLLEGSERDALVVTVHAFQIFVGQRKRHQAVGLHIAQAQLRG